jgi:cell division protein ZapA
MSPQKASVTVRIAGEEHTIRANAEPEYTKRCAKLVDDRIHEIRIQAGPIEGHKAAILAALSIADQYFQAIDELEYVRKEVAARATNLTRRIEAEVPAGAHKS